MYTGPNIVKGTGLGVVVDPSSVRGLKSAAETNLIDYSTWIVGNTSATGFGRNGSSSENIIEYGDGPYGEESILWASRNNDTRSDADGGWNGSSFAVDSSAMYRWSVWLRRPVVGNGYAYLGLYGLDSSSSNIGVLRRSNHSSTTNHYFIVPNYNVFSTNQWYLLVGHTWPVGTGTGASHVDSGMWLPNGNKIGGAGDAIFKSGTTQARHRSYLYYSTDPATVQQWAYPRVDKIDGTEPSLSELLSGNTREIKNLRNPSQKFYLANNVRARRAANIGKGKVKKFAFDATNDYIKVDGSTTSALQRTTELIFRVNSVNAGYMPIATYTRASGGTESGKRIWLGVQNGRFQMHGWGTTDPASTTNVTNGDWYHCVYGYDQSTKNHYIWVNGVLEHTSTNSQGGMTGWNNSADLSWWLGRDPQASGWSSNAGQYFSGDIGLFKTYSKILSNSEVARNYRAYKNRFNLG